jgi:hypothetical protein
MSSNPYSSPRAAASAPAAQRLGTSIITPRMLALMAEARWWTLVLALLAFLLTGLLLLALLLITVGTVEGAPGVGPVEMAVVGVMLLLYGAPAVLLFLSSQKLATFVSTRRAEDLVSALSMQRTLWIVLGLIGTLWGALTTLRLVLTALYLYRGMGG